MTDPNIAAFLRNNLRIHVTRPCGEPIVNIELQIREPSFEGSIIEEWKTISADTILLPRNK